MNNHRKKWRAARIGSTVLLVATLFWASPFALTFWNRIYILRNRGGFSKAQFVVSSIEYYSDADYGPIYCAQGELRGVTERLSLKNALDATSELAGRVPEGTIFTVLYNPALTRSIVQGETPRVMLYTDDFWEKQEAAAHRLGAYMFLPIGTALLVKIGIAVLAGRR